LTRLLGSALVVCVFLSGARALAQDSKASPTPASQKAVDRELAIATGKSLLESSTKSKRMAALGKATSLEAAEQRVLISWASDHASDPRAGNLIPFLRKLDSKRAAELLVEIAAATRGEEDDGSIADEALDALLYGQRVSHSIPVATEAALRTTDPHAAQRIQSGLVELIKEGPEEEQVKSSLLIRSLVGSIQKVLRGRDLPPGTRERAVSLVSSLLIDTDEIGVLLQQIRRRLEDEDRVFLDGLLRGMALRRESLYRPIHLLRAQEANRRAKLEPSRREQLADIGDWLEDRVRRDKRLSLLARRLESDAKIFEDLLLERLANSENTPLKLLILRLAPTYAKGPDSKWVPALIPHVEGSVGTQTYQLLKKLTGEDIPQNRVLWSRWFNNEDEDPSGGGE
tara:strand:- start:1238 stop:2434 length:1197 start_codon:yes stop_codon:yes gene_type:complete